ncbi:MAG: hypothetical protein AB8B65_00810 [Kordia sp.]|uniref:hypothetical protein n=1 Tax=Kordia sp. TaxID=1965332 RepID=UPI00385C7920
MSKQKILTYLYFCLLILDLLGVIYPDAVDRTYTTFLPFPALIVLYFCSVKKVNWLYVASLLSTFLGIIFFNMETYRKPALIFYGIGVLIYVIIALKKAGEIPIRSIFIAAIPFLVIYLVPLFYYYDEVKMEIFNYILFYVFSVGLFFFISTLVYTTRQNKPNLWLLSSGIVFVISTTIHGQNLFFGYIMWVRAAVVLTFLYMHYAMYRYTIANKK